MTCIVGLIEDGKVWMGGDRAVNDRGEVTRTAHSKVVLRGEILLGASGGAGATTLLRYSDCVKTIDPYNLHQSICTEFTRALADEMKDYNLLTHHDGRAEHAGAIIVGARGRLFQVDSVFAVSERDYPYWAIGQGGPEALASLYTTEFPRSPKIIPRIRVELALGAAAEFCDGVQGPFDIISTED